jgi:small subunit ribosomal protein S1
MIKLTRQEKPEEGIAFVAMPDGQQALGNGHVFHFDKLYHEVCVPAIRDCGMTAERADHLWSASEGVLEAVWRGIQRAEVVIVDCTTRSADVYLELGLVMALGKRSVVLAQCLADIPTDLRGRVRPVLYQATGLAALRGNLRDQLQIVRGEAATENTLVPISGPEPVPGSIAGVTRERAMVETTAGGRHQFWELSRADVDYTRLIPDMTRWFAVGETLAGTIVTDLDGYRHYTLLAGQRDPWPGLIAGYQVGTTFTSRVVSVREGVGAFISITGGIKGRVPCTEARQAGLARDAQVVVEVVRVDPVLRQVGLRLAKVAAGGPALVAVPPSPAAGLPPVGTRLLGEIIRAVPQEAGRGGYLLVRLDGWENGPLAILHWKRMSRELREDLNDSRVDLISVELTVEVIRVDPSRRRIELLELPEENQEAAATAA